MEAVSFDEMPLVLNKIAQQINEIENILAEKQPPHRDTPKKKYTLPEAAKYCGMAEPTFRTYIYRRRVAGTKFGKAWLFLESDLDKFINDYRRPTVHEMEAKAFEDLTSKRRG